MPSAVYLAQKRKSAFLTSANDRAGEGSDPTYFPSMKAAAYSLKVDIAILKDARGKACPAFIGSGAVHKAKLIEWLKNNPYTTPAPLAPEEDFKDDYNPPDETGGVGQTLKSLQAYERRLKRRLDEIEKAPGITAMDKAERVKSAQEAWIKVVNSLLKYDLAVDMAKRESGELLPMAEAVKAVQALLAWHTVATSDALRNVIPECEGKNKYQIAALLDPVLRSAIYRNFKLGMKIGKIPEWMGKTASDFVRAEPAMTLDGVAPQEAPSTNLDDY